jgi:hypothetical protein
LVNALSLTAIFGVGLVEIIMRNTNCFITLRPIEKILLESRDASASQIMQNEPGYFSGKNFVLWLAIVISSTEQVKRKTRGLGALSKNSSFMKV